MKSLITKTLSATSLKQYLSTPKISPSKYVPQIQLNNGASLPILNQESFEILQKFIGGSSSKKIDLISLTDFDEDNDDTMQALLVSFCVQSGLIDKHLAITTQFPAQQRAVNLNSLLSKLLPDEMNSRVNVVAGADCNEENRKNIVLPQPLFRQDKITSGPALKRATEFLEKSHNAGKKAVLFGHAGFTNFAELLRTQPDLVKKTVDKIFIQGGIVLDNSGFPRLDHNGFCIPHPDVFNNKCDYPAAVEFYAAAQHLKIPLTVTTRIATDNAGVGVEPLFQGLVETGHPCGKNIAKIATELTDDFFKRVLAADPSRPSRITPEFLLKELAQLKPDTKAFENALTEMRENRDFRGSNIWKNAKVYDLIAGLVTLAHATDNKFLQDQFDLAHLSNNVSVCGLDSKRHGIVNRESLEKIICSVTSGPLIAAQQKEILGKTPNLSQYNDYNEYTEDLKKQVREMMHSSEDLTR